MGPNGPKKKGLTSIQPIKSFRMKKKKKKGAIMA
jgi:hypothetical protein